MRSSNQSKIKFWSDHIAAAAVHSAGIAPYCKDHGLSLTMYYKWKTRLLKAAVEKPSVFLPVTVAAAPVTEESKLRSRELPNAQWVAEVLAHLLRTLQ